MDNGFRGNLLPRTAADDGYGAFRHQRQPLHRPFGADFLDDADDRIDHRHHQKAHVQGTGTADDEHHGQNHENQVKKGEAVGQNDFFFAFAGADGFVYFENTAEVRFRLNRIIFVADRQRIERIVIFHLDAGAFFGAGAAQVFQGNIFV